ncbi:MAG: tetratricopeptide repeat protein [Treponema sp.]|jgi:tetratricopeptide (TPR) repeat protein|nr:tetratricopeptide repeat protein [Treponema sp.]
MKNPVALNLALCAVALLTGCAGSPAAQQAAPPENLLSLDAAMAGAASAVKARAPGGAEIALAKFDAPLEALADFLNDELSDRFNAGGALKVLARGKALQSVDREHDFQMSGLVSDESAVGIGHYLGAKVVVTGTFDRFAAFSQFRIRAVDVETGALLASYSARIDNRDAVLAAVTAPLADRPAAAITENALDHLNRGKDLYAEGKLDEAVAEFGKALAINGELSEAFLYRGAAYGRKGDHNRAIADFGQAISINPDYALAYNNRGLAYNDKGDYDRAIADYSQALRINPDYADAYTNRGNAYNHKGDYERGIADYGQAISINPDYALAYTNRGVAYYNKGDHNRAIADYNQALRINPDYADAWYNRGNAYYGKGDYDLAIADYTQAIRINPNLAIAYINRGNAYTNKGDYDRAIADYETALRINPNNASARKNLDLVRQRRGR